MLCPKCVESILNLTCGHGATLLAQDSFGRDGTRQHSEANFAIREFMSWHDSTCVAAVFWAQLMPRPLPLSAATGGFAAALKAPCFRSLRFLLHFVRTSLRTGGTGHHYCLGSSWVSLGRSSLICWCFYVSIYPLCSGSGRGSGRTPVLHDSALHELGAAF